MPYNVLPTTLPEVLILEPKLFSDDRGFFFESFNAREFTKVTCADRNFVQDNHSRSAKGVLRGLHYQVVRPQGKLVRVVSGEVWDVAVDIRKDSPNFGKWTGTVLSEKNKRQLWIPEGFAHGFLVLSEWADFLYKTTDYRYAEYERCIAWDDPEIGIDWPTDIQPVLSEKDMTAPRLCDAQVSNVQFIHGRYLDAALLAGRSA